MVVEVKNERNKCSRWYRSYPKSGKVEEDRIVGFMSLVKELVSERMILDLIQVDKEFRGRGIGRILWEKAVEEAQLNGAKELYISACPSEETIKQNLYAENTGWTD